MKQKRILFVLLVFVVAVLLTGCFGPSRRLNPPPGTSTITGTVYFGTPGGLFASHAKVRIGDTEVETDEMGKFVIDNTMIGEQLVTIETPVNTVHQQKVQIKRNTNLELVVPWPTNFDQEMFAQFACLTVCIDPWSGSGLPIGTERWEHGAEIRYFIDTSSSQRDKKEVKVTGSHESRIRAAFDTWVVATGLLDYGVFSNLERTYNQHDANIVIKFDDISTGNDEDVFYTWTVEDFDVVDNELRRVVIVINNLESHMNANQPYYQSVAFALGGWYHHRDYDSIFYFLSENRGGEEQVKEFLEKRYTSNDLNLMRALYSVAPGTIAK